MIVVFADLPGDEVHQLRPVVDRIRELRDASLASIDAQGVMVGVTGLPAIAVDEQDAIVVGLGLVMTLGIGCCLLGALQVLPALLLVIGRAR